MSKTCLTSAESHCSSPAIRLMWKSNPLIRMLRMSKVPIAGQPSLSAKANGIIPSFCIFVIRVVSSSSVAGAS